MALYSLYFSHKKETKGGGQIGNFRNAKTMVVDLLKWREKVRVVLDLWFVTLSLWQRVRKSITEEGEEEGGDEAEKPMEEVLWECSEPTRLLGKPNPSEPEAWDRTETSLSLGAPRRRMGARMERGEGEVRCSGGTQQRAGELIAIFYFFFVFLMNFGIEEWKCVKYCERERRIEGDDRNRDSFRGLVWSFFLRIYCLSSFGSVSPSFLLIGCF